MNERLQELKTMAEKAWFVFHNERDYAHENAMLLDQLDRFAKQVESEAVAKERERLKALKPVAMVDHSHPFSDDSVYMIANYERSFPSGTKLYALDEVTK